MRNADLMLTGNVRQYVQGAETIESLWGGWPRFHDAEVRSVLLDREGPAAHLEIVTAAADHGARVTLHCSVIEDLELHGFNIQNVLAELVLSEHSAGIIKVELQGIYGVSGFICCRSLVVVDVRKP